MIHSKLLVLLPFLEGTSTLAWEVTGGPAQNMELMDHDKTRRLVREGTGISLLTNDCLVTGYGKIISKFEI